MSRDWEKDMELLQKPHKEVADVVTILDGIAPYWHQEAEKWRVEAFRKYPTPDAYDAACAALDKHRARADKLQSELSAAQEELARINIDYYADKQRFVVQRRELEESKAREKKLKEAIERCIFTYDEEYPEDYLESVLASLYPKEGEE